MRLLPKMFHVSSIPDEIQIPLQQSFRDIRYFFVKRSLIFTGGYPVRGKHTEDPVHRPNQFNHN